MLAIYEEISMEYKELYRAVELDVITFASTDVIVTSDDDSHECYDEIA